MQTNLWCAMVCLYSKNGGIFGKKKSLSAAGRLIWFLSPGTRMVRKLGQGRSQERVLGVLEPPSRAKEPPYMATQHGAGTQTAAIKRVDLQTPFQVFRL